MFTSSFPSIKLIIQLYEFLQISESERNKLKVQIGRLNQENNWLRDELTTTQYRLEASEKSVCQLEEENKQMLFMNEMRKYDSPDDGKDSAANNADKADNLSSDLGFTDEEKDQEPNDGEINIVLIALIDIHTIDIRVSRSLPLIHILSRCWSPLLLIAASLSFHDCT